MALRTRYYADETKQMLVAGSGLAAGVLIGNAVGGLVVSRFNPQGIQAPVVRILTKLLFGIALYIAGTALVDHSAGKHAAFRYAGKGLQFVGAGSSIIGIADAGSEILRRLPVVSGLVGAGPQFYRPGAFTPQNWSPAPNVRNYRPTAHVTPARPSAMPTMGTSVGPATNGVKPPVNVTAPRRVAVSA